MVLQKTGAETSVPDLVLPLAIAGKQRTHAKPVRDKDNGVLIGGVREVGYTHPLSFIASATRWTESMYAAIRMFTLCFVCIA